MKKLLSLALALCLIIPPGCSQAPKKFSESFQAMDTFMRLDIYGADCTEQFKRLFELFKSGGSGVLAIPKLGTVHAVFESLKIKGIPKPDVLTYSFVFREVMEREVMDKPESYTPSDGETLWDVSYRFDIVIDRLVALNPDIKRPDENLGGRAVALC